jgi:Zn-dependent protease with chaperone function
MFTSMDKPAIVNMASFIECQVFWTVCVLFSLSETLQFDNTGVSSFLGNFIWALFFVIALKFSQKREYI